jgi:DNA processing protein
MEFAPMMPPLTTDVCDLLALNLVPGIGPRLTTALLDHFGSAAAARRASAKELQQISHIGAQLASKFATALAAVDLQAEVDLMVRHKTGLLVLGSQDYPASLASTSAAPHILYVRGTLMAGDARSVAIVGSRRSSPYGKRTAHRLAADLARAGVTIISGLARGIDAAAHRGALEAGGRTIGVLAGGLSRIYPPEHTQLAADVEKAGALLSEAPMDADPLPMMFPARNRIISGLAQAVVLVEAAERSGAIITAKHALDQNRPVFGVPGPVDSESSAGIHTLLREGAILCRNATDVLEELDGVASSGAVPVAAATAATLDPTEKQLIELLVSEPRHLDDLVAGLGLSVPRLSHLLMSMEMKKLVRRLPGNRYERA